MTNEEAKEFLITISYKLGNMSIEYLTEKGGEKMREAIKALEQQTCEDAVSRQFMKEMGATCIAKRNENEFIPIIAIDALPSVNPQPICEDAVSRQAVLDIFAKNADAIRSYSVAWEKISDLPPVNPQPICEEREKGECPYYAG